MICIKKLWQCNKINKKRPKWGVFCLGGTYPPPKSLKRQQYPFTLIFERFQTSPPPKKIGRAELLKKILKIPLVSRWKNLNFKNSVYLRFKEFVFAGWYVYTFWLLKCKIWRFLSVLERVLFVTCGWIFKNPVFC